MLSNVNFVLSVGSVDGVCTAAAVLRLTGRSAEVGLAFCQAFTVDKVDPSAWPAGRKVAFVDLAVNNREAAMTASLIQRIREAGHEVVAIIDEHSREDWLGVMGTFEGLIVEPQSQKAEGGPRSSGELLRRALEAAGVEADGHTLELLSAADAGDRMDFTTRFGGAVNKAVKSDIANDARRVYLARHFAVHAEPDTTIQRWMAEYEEILANHQAILDGRTELGDGIVRVDARGKRVDMTTLMGQLYGLPGVRVVALVGEAYNKALGKKTIQVSFGCREQLDILAAVKAVVPTASGFAQKANVDPEAEEAAIAAVRAMLAG
ncbi:TPA: hypothetical protein DEA21_03070 [Candidatus Uhrbacteria bacterium]|nr:hypothetical protein [Candidatus Uhrbacteria bacterium]